MGTGAKIAIGCLVAVAVTGMVVLVVVFGGAYWLKGKAEEMKAEQEQIDELVRKADANPFTRPADNRIQEDRLVKFIEVRKVVFAAYSKHEKVIQKAKNKNQADLSDVRQVFNIVNEIRMAQAKAQADQGMSSEEYRFLVEQVYRSFWASEVAKASGKSAAEAAAEGTEQAAEGMEKTADDTDMPEEARRALRDAAERVRSGGGEIQEQLKALDVPKENVELFRKYEREIQKYAMTGLEWIGL